MIVMDFETEYFGGKMPDMVMTIFGLIPRENLDVTEQIVEDAYHRTVRTIWTLREDITEVREGGTYLRTFTYPPEQAADGSAVPGTERTVLSRKGEVVKADAHVIAKRGVEIIPGQGFLNS